MERFPQLAESTLPGVLMHRARLAPDGIASVICASEGEDEVYTIAEVLGLAGAFAAHYREHAVPGRQSLVCVCLYHGVALHAAFLGAVLAGEIPSIIAPPSPRMERDKYVRSFAAMMEHLRPDLVVTDGTALQGLEALEVESLSGARSLDAAQITSSQVAIPGDLAIPVAPVSPDDIAFLQHSSGTTGLQKGVALGHRSVLNQVRSYARALDLSPDDVIASWLPLYHDMGLIASFVLPLLTGLPVVEMSPFDWVNRPALLGRKIKQYRATLCSLPNFAYSFMSTTVRESQLEEVDFSTVRAFVNCSEPVMAASHRQFAGRYAGRGVVDTQLTACYAMAENVFAVTQSPIGRAPRLDTVCRRTFEREHRAEPRSVEPSMTLVSNGPPVDGVEVKVVDDAGRQCAERQVGEIWITGSSLFSGYFGRQDLTADSFDGDWYKSGDLGYLAAGELYVTGRKKDLIIIQGRNFYPNDLESAVGEIEGVLRGRVAAFGDSDAESGTESLVIIAETDLEETAAKGRLNLQIRSQIAQAFDCTVGAVHLVPPRWLVKSSSGKVARPDNRRKYEALLKG